MYQWIKQTCFVQNGLLKELINYIQNTAKKYRSGLEYSIRKEVAWGCLKDLKFGAIPGWLFMNLKFLKDFWKIPSILMCLISFVAG